MARNVVKTEAPDFDAPLSVKSVGRFIRASRTAQGIDLETMAMLCGVSAPTLSNVENGKAGIRLSTVLKICEGLGIRLMFEPWEEADV